MAFRILNFCGGGMRGLMSVLILRRLNDRFHARYGKTLAEQADMIAGTSTGSVITGLLTIGLTPDEIVAYYLEVMAPQFRKGNQDPNAPMLPPGTVITLLDKFHLDPPISKFAKKLLFTSFDIGAERVPWSPQLINNFPGSPTAEMGLLDAISGSCSMPGMTSPHPVKLGEREFHLVDGAFAHHDPSVPAISLAVASGVALPEITAIDIGTGFMRNFVSADAEQWGANQWLHGSGAKDGVLPPLLVNIADTPANEAPILNMCMNGTSTSMMPDLAGMLLGDRFAYLNPDFGDHYIPEDVTTAEGLAFLTLKAEECPLDAAMAVLDQYWAD